MPTPHQVIAVLLLSLYSSLYCLFCLVYFCCFVLPCQIRWKLSVTRARVLIHPTTRWVAWITVFRRTPGAARGHHHVDDDPCKIARAFSRRLKPGPVKLLNPMTNKPISVLFFIIFFAVLPRQSIIWLFRDGQIATWGARSVGITCSHVDPTTTTMTCIRHRIFVSVNNYYDLYCFTRTRIVKVNVMLKNSGQSLTFF